MYSSEISDPTTSHIHCVRQTFLTLPHHTLYSSEISDPTTSYNVYTIQKFLILHCKKRRVTLTMQLWLPQLHTAFMPYLLLFQQLIAIVVLE